MQPRPAKREIVGRSRPAIVARENRSHEAFHAAARDAEEAEVAGLEHQPEHLDRPRLIGHARLIHRSETHDHIGVPGTGLLHDPNLVGRLNRTALTQKARPVRDRSPGENRAEPRPFAERQVIALEQHRFGTSDARVAQNFGKLFRLADLDHVRTGESAGTPHKEPGRAFGGQVDVAHENAA